MGQNAGPQVKISGARQMTGGGQELGKLAKSQLWAILDQCGISVTQEALSGSLSPLLSF